MLQIIETPEDLQIGSWSFSFYSRSRREGNPIRTMMLALYDRMEQTVLLVLDTETDSSRLSCTHMLSQTERTRSHSGLRMRWTPIQTFLKRVRSVSYGIAPSTLTTKLLTREKQVYETRRHFVRNRMPRRRRQQCFNNTVVNIAACQLQGRMLHLWKSMHYQG